MTKKFRSRLSDLWDAMVEIIVELLPQLLRLAAKAIRALLD